MFVQDVTQELARLSWHSRFSFIIRGMLFGKGGVEVSCFLLWWCNQGKLGILKLSKASV
jgi:hypothetical protein